MNKLFSRCRKKMTKENMIVLALSGVLLMVVAIPTGKEKNKTDESRTSIKDAEKLIQAFFDAETNNDLYQNRIVEHPEFKEQSGLLETLKEMEVFPQKWLKENGNQLSNLCVAIRGGK